MTGETTALVDHGQSGVASVLERRRTLFENRGQVLEQPLPVERPGRYLDTAVAFGDVTSPVELSEEQREQLRERAREPRR